MRYWLAPCLALVAGVAGCARPPNDDVRVQMDGAYLVIENRTGADIHQFVASDPDTQAWVPSSLPANRLETGRRIRMRIAPSERGAAWQVNWWRPGKKLADGTRGADLVRRKSIRLDELAEPMPLDEQVVRACMALRSARAAEQRSFNSAPSQAAARNYNAAGAEQDCMAQGDDCLISRDCEQQMYSLQAMLDQTRAVLKGRG